jgi:hypothetical protein
VSGNVNGVAQTSHCLVFGEFGLATGRRKQSVAEGADPSKWIRALAAHGQYGRGRPHPENDRGSNTTSELGRGALYTLARLDRDRPDLAGRIIPGVVRLNTCDGVKA